jgi:hypothetical protein
MLPLLRMTMMESRKSWGKRVGWASTCIVNTINTMQEAFKAGLYFVPPILSDGSYFYFYVPDAYIMYFIWRC